MHDLVRSYGSWQKLAESSSCTSLYITKTITLTLSQRINNGYTIKSVSLCCTYGWWKMCRRGMRWHNFHHLQPKYNARCFDNRFVQDSQDICDQVHGINKQITEHHSDITPDGNRRRRNGGRMGGRVDGVER